MDTMNNVYPMLVDPMLRELVNVLNETGYIKTVSCCQGHGDEKDIFQDPYIALYCKASKLKKFCHVLSIVDEILEDNDIPIQFCPTLVFAESVQGCQEDAPSGWVAIDLKFEPAMFPIQKVLSVDQKEVVFECLARAFKQKTPSKKNVHLIRKDG